MDENQKITNVQQALRSYCDFPKKGILFWDIFSLLRDPSATRDLLQLMEQMVETHCPQVDVFVGLEARGFLFGLPMATAFNKPFVPVRKKGKLPGNTIHSAYKLEYGEDVIEFQEGSIKEGQTVVILDDLLATGGTLQAANELISSVKARVGLNLVCIELTELEGRSQISSPVQSLLQL